MRLALLGQLREVDLIKQTETGRTCIQKPTKNQPNLPELIQVRLGTQGKYLMGLLQQVFTGRMLILSTDPTASSKH